MKFQTKIVLGASTIVLFSLVINDLISTLSLTSFARWGLQAAIVLLAAVAAYFAARRLSRPLSRLQAEIEIIEHESDLTRRMTRDRYDEVGAIAASLNRMFYKFNDIIEKIMMETTQLTDAAEQMSSVAAESQQKILRQQSETDQVATAVTEMSATVSEVAQNTTRAASAADQASQTAVQGQEVVLRAINSTDEVAKYIKSASEVVAKLESRSENIDSVLDVIRSIAEQTNLLALNAAIEAARAGEQGRGFAVVADEVRSLASRTQASTVEIQSMIEQLQAEAKRSVETMEQSHIIAGNSIEQTREAGEAFSGIVERVNEINDMNIQIASASEEQSAVAEEINRNVVVISEMAQHTTEGSFQIASASEQISNLAEELQALVRTFKVSGQKNFDFAAARAAHLAWKTKLRGYLDGKASLSREQAVSHRHCMLGQWYYGGGMENYGQLKEMREIEVPHTELHRLIGAIIEAKEQGELEDAERLFLEIEPLSQQIVSLLDAVAAKV